jgi:beta,beta-carotene 9',10'-dioxygenase
MRTNDYRAGFAALEEEVEVERLPIEGDIPTWLSGTLIRNGPGTWEAGRQKLRHWFDGLAMLHRFGFGGGEVCYANKFIESPQYRHVRERGEIGYPEFATDPCRSIFKRLTTAFSPPGFGHNTSVSVHKLAERFVALTETPLPVEFDPRTLRTVGVLEFDDDIAAIGSSPHPHFDPVTGDFLNTITYFSRESSYKLFRVPNGRPGTSEKPRRQVVAELPVKEPAYMHSFGQTEHYVVLAEYPLVVNPLKMLLNGRPYAENLEWKPERPTRFLVVEKKSGGLVSIREADPFFCFHHVNAFERDGELFVDLLAYPDASIIQRLYLDVLRNPDEDVADASVAELRRYRIGLTDNEGGPAGYEILSDEQLELPRIDYEGRNGREYSCVYGVGLNKEKQSGWVDQLVKVDVRERASRTWYREGCYPGEPVFVPALDGSGEDDGVILSVVLDAAGDGSFLLVLDARSFEEVARACVPHRVPFGFHGRYFGESVR